MVCSDLLSREIGLEGRVPWSQAMFVGDGFDATESHTSKSACTVSKVSPLSQMPSYKLETHHEIIQNDSDMAAAFGLCTKNILSRQELNAAPAVQFLRNHPSDGRYLRAVLNCTITGSPEILDNELVFQAEAEKVLNDEGESTFVSRYGTHYIAGYTRQAEFLAMIHMKLSEHEDVLSAKEKLEGALADLCHGNNSISTRMPDASTSNVRVRFSYTGSRYILEKPLHTLSSILPVFQGWKSALQLQPRVALLKHYSFKTHRIVSPRALWLVDTDIFQAHKELISITCWLAQIDVHTLTSINAPSDVPPELQHLANTLETISSTPDTDSTDSALKDWWRQLRECKQRLSEKYEFQVLRSRFHEKVQASRTEDAWPKNTKMYPTRAKPVFTTGLIPSQHPLRLQPLIDVYVWDFSKDAADAGIVQKELLRYSPAQRKIKTLESQFSQPLNMHSKADVAGTLDSAAHAVDQPIIIGMRATSDREPDHHNNGWFRLIKGGVGFPFVELLFETSHWRGAEWTIEIWSLH